MLTIKLTSSAVCHCEHALRTVPLGVASTPAIFQRAMAHAVCCIDDILLMSKSILRCSKMTTVPWNLFEKKQVLLPPECC